jgi:hypothetical protein
MPLRVGGDGDRTPNWAVLTQLLRRQKLGPAQIEEGRIQIFDSAERPQ